MHDTIEKVLAREVRPTLAKHGGNVELVEVTPEGVVKVRLTGGCAGCPSAHLTVIGVVEEAIKNRIPAVKRVEAV
jgi:Fe-S cluster biogenesis protein NfuA